MCARVCCVHLCLGRELHCQAVSQSYRLRAGQLLEAKPHFHFHDHTSRKTLKLQPCWNKWESENMQHQRQEGKVRD